MIGTTELLLIFSVMLLLFGANKLPMLGRALGESIKNFKKGINSEDEILAKKELPSQDQSKKDIT